MKTTHRFLQNKESTELVSAAGESWSSFQGFLAVLLHLRSSFHWEAAPQPPTLLSQFTTPLASKAVSSRDTPNCSLGLFTTSHRHLDMFR